MSQMNVFSSKMMRVKLIVDKIMRIKLKINKSLTNTAHIAFYSCTPEKQMALCVFYLNFMYNI